MNNFFSHDSNARNDEKIIALRMKHGWEGYGLFWTLVEKLRDATGYRLSKDYNLLAFDLRVDASIVKSIINDFGLFAFSDECFYSESLLRRMEIKDSKSEKARQSALSRWNKEANAEAMQTHSDGNASKVKQSKVKQSNSSSDELLCETSQPHTDSIDFLRLVDFFNDETKGVFGIVKLPLSEKRRGMVRARIREHGKDAFGNAILQAYKSDFLKGNNNGSFKMTFDWLIKPTNFEKVISGNYDNKATHTTSRSDAASDDLARSVAEGIARANFERQ